MRDINIAFCSKLLSLAVADFKDLYPEVDMRSFLGVTYTRLGGRKHYFVESDTFNHGLRIQWDGIADNAYEARYNALRSFLEIIEFGEGIEKVTLPINEKPQGESWSVVDGNTEFNVWAKESA
jgi:hypothetical protein